MVAPQPTNILRISAHASKVKMMNLKPTYQKYVAYVNKYAMLYNNN